MNAPSVPSLMAESDAAVDPTDIRLIGALQIDGRASSARIGAALDLPERTVARRINRLLDTGMVRVVRAVPLVDFPQGAMTVRAKVLRGNVETVANALAGRGDVLFVDIHLGGEEISAIAAPVDGERLLFDELPTSTAITSWSAQAILHVFADAASWQLGALTAAEIGALRQRSARPAASVAASTPTDPFDPADRPIIEALNADARQPLAALAKRVHMTEPTLRRHLDRLAAAGHCRAVCVVDAALVGFGVDANVAMSVPPSKLHAVGTKLAKNPAVHGLFATTGSTNLQGALFCRDRDDLYRFMTDTLGSLRIPSAQVAIVSRAVKRAGVPYVRSGR